MTRQEEIQRLIDKEMGIDNYGSSDYQVGVCDGVILADKTMVEKMTQWLYNHLTTEYHGAVLKIVAKEKGLMPVEFVERFKKAMLEEE